MIKKIIANGINEYSYIKLLSQRATNAGTEIENNVKKIINDVKTNGDSAVLEYSKQFDGIIEIKTLNYKDFEQAFNSLEPRFKEALLQAKENIVAFHSKQLQKGFEISENGKKLGQIVRPLERVGLYVPGGTATYPSSVLMNAIPAKIAGVSEIVMVSPTPKGYLNQSVLGAAYVAGVDVMYTIGGAQAVAALAYGTQTIKKVDKIVGPGNVYVATAKKLVFGTCDIDMVAGPSEIMILADQNANPKYIAADLMSQAEHDTLASAILVTTSSVLADKVIDEINIQIQKLNRKDIIQKSLESYGAVIITETEQEMFDLANLIAPEHLEILTASPEQHLEKILNAGSVFLGEFAPEPLGDYFAGTNHVLPTGGTARFSSPLSVDDFVKRIQYIQYDKESFIKAKEMIACLANNEGLDAHANSVKVRE